MSAPGFYSIKRSGSRDSTGKLLEVVLQQAVLTYGDNGQQVNRPQGLALSTSGGPAVVKVSVGDSDGGEEKTRTVTVLREGLWLCCAGWSWCKVEVLTLPDGASVGFAWTTQQPPSGQALLYLETIAAGTDTVPEGAYEVAGSAADAGWQWSTNTGGGAIVLNAPMVAGTVFQPVVGQERIATGVNVLAWKLRTL